MPPVNSTDSRNAPDWYMGVDENDRSASSAAYVPERHDTAETVSYGLGYTAHYYERYIMDTIYITADYDDYNMAISNDVALLIVLIHHGKVVEYVYSGNKFIGCKLPEYYVAVLQEMIR